MSRRLLIGLYGVATVLTILTLTSLGLGFPEVRFAGQELTLLMAVTLVGFVVGMIGLVDYLRWPERRNQPSGVRIMSAGVVVIGFAVGYFLGSRVFDDEESRELD